MTPAETLLAGRYQLGEPIGTGGFCQVWRASDTVLSRPVAVKLLHAGYAQQAEALARFKAEALHAGSLSHPNIARVYDYGPSPATSPMVQSSSPMSSASQAPSAPASHGHKKGHHGGSDQGNQNGDAQAGD